MDVCIEWCLSSCLAGWPIILCDRNFIVGHYSQTFQPNLFILCVLLGSIDFYHFIPHSLTLTMAWSHKVSAKQNLLASFPPTLFNWWGWNMTCWWSNSSWTSWYYFWIRFIETREITAVLMTASKNFNIGMHFGIHESIWFKLPLPWLWFKATGVPESKNFCANYLTKFPINLNGIRMEFGMLLRVVDVMWELFILILFHPLNIQEGGPCLCDSNEKN